MHTVQSSMDITKFIVARREKALLVGDYGSYRTQLSRRLLVVRRKLNYTSTRNRRYSAKAPISTEDIKSNHEWVFRIPSGPGAKTTSRFVHLLLLTAERAWAQAMHMKSTHSADAGTKAITGSTRQHISSKLHKASTYAQSLVELLQDQEACGATQDDLFEARAYYISLRGAVEFEKQSWQTCLQSYSEARLIYACLAISGNTKRDDVFKDLLSTTIDPSIRYAAYQSKLPRTTTIDTIVARYIPRDDNKYTQEILKTYPDALNEGGSGQKKGAGGEAQDVPKTIRWRSREVDLEDASTALALAVVSGAESKLSSFLSSNPDLDAKAKAAAYDDVLIPSQDAVDSTKTAIDELASEGVSQGDRRMQALQITRTAVNYALVGWRIGRNRVLCGSQDGALLEDEMNQKPRRPRKDGKPHKQQEEGTGRKLTRLRERVVLYDATLQSLDSVKGLPGVAADQAFVQELDVKREYFASLRCLAIARSHALLSNTKNALALFARALDLCPQLPPSSQTDTSPSKPPNLEVNPSQTSSLHTLLQGLVHRHHALVELHHIYEADVKAAEAKAKTALPMIERLNEFPVNGADLNNLVTYPPKIQPIPVKPLFFDFASNYIEYPGRGREKDGGKVDVIEEAKKETKRGWFGFGR